MEVRDEWEVVAGNPDLFMRAPGISPSLSLGNFILLQLFTSRCGQDSVDCRLTSPSSSSSSLCSNSDAAGTASDVDP